MAKAGNKKKRKPPGWLAIPVALALLAGAAWVLRDQLRAHSFTEVTEVLGSLPAWRLVASALATVLGYLALIGHDYIALQHLRLTVPLRRVALTAYIAYAFSNSAPLSFAVAGTLRLRYYAKWGLDAADTGRLVGLTLTTYTLGLLCASAVALTVGRFPMPHLLPFHMHDSLPLGIAAAVILVAYLVWTAVRGKALGAKHHEALGPTLGFAATQIGISLADWLLSGVALYLLIDAKHPVFFGTFFGVFILGQLVSLIAQLPGGLGVFDAVMIWGLSSVVPAPITLAALLAYRVIYYLVPLLVAVGLIFATEGFGIFRRKKPPPRSPASRRPDS